jgi:hypothetical protein
MVKYRSLIFLALLFLTGTGFCLKKPLIPIPGSPEIKYSVATIPDSLKENADLIVRDYTMDLQVKSLTAAVIKVHLVLTLLRASAVENANLSLYYDRFSKVKSIKFVCYNATGIQTKKSKSSDIIDESAISYGIFYEENRVKKVKLLPDSYPVTVEYTYEIDLSEFIEYPSMQPQEDYRVSVEHAELNITALNEFFPRLRTRNFSQQPLTNKNGNETTLTYSFQNLAAVEEEKFSIPLSDRVPEVDITANDFKTLGNVYDWGSWKTYGLWDYDLNKDRDILPEKTIERVKLLIKDKVSDLDKIKSIYHFVQENTRYVALSLGLGGWQTSEAKEVAEKGYGDCKGLVNYTKALLSVAGIRSYATIIKAGRNESDILTDFPSSQFNHVILCIPHIPGASDTLWLECTDQKMPFGYLGSFTDNRHALIITPDGGVLVKTPSYQGNMNTICRKVIIDLDSVGNANVSITGVYRGLEYDNLMPMENASVKDLVDAFQKTISTPAAMINKINYKFLKDQLPEAIETVNLSIRSYASRTGNRLFIPFYMFTSATSCMNQRPNRKTPVSFRYSYIDSDTVEVHIPHGFTVESIPGTLEADSRFGHYKVTVTQVGDVLKYTRVSDMKEGRYAPESFSELSAFLQKRNHADKANAVLIKK